MTTANKETVSPSWCPACQRLFRQPPPDYACPVDGVLLIDVADPFPASPLRRAAPFATTLAILAIAVGVLAV